MIFFVTKTVENAQTDVGMATFSAVRTVINALPSAQDAQTVATAASVQLVTMVLTVRTLAHRVAGIGNVIKGQVAVRRAVRMDITLKETFVVAVLITVIAVQMKTCVQSVKQDTGEANVSKIAQLHVTGVHKRDIVY